MKKNRTPFKLEMKRTAKTVRIVMSGYIERWNRNSAQEVAKLLEQVGKNDKLEVMIRNLYGGSVMEGLLIYHDLKALKPLMLLDGVAASMGAIIFQAGDTRRMSKHSKLMLHRVSAGVSGDPDQMATELKQIRAWEKELCQILMERTGLDEKAVRSKYMVTGTDCWLDAKQCLKAKLADEVVEGSLRRNVTVEPEEDDQEMAPEDILERFEAAMRDEDEDEENDSTDEDEVDEDDADGNDDDDEDGDDEEDEDEEEDTDDDDEDDADADADESTNNKKQPLLMKLFGKTHKALEALAKKPAAKLTPQALSAADAELKKEGINAYLVPVTNEVKSAEDLNARLEAMANEAEAWKKKAIARKAKLTAAQEELAQLSNKSLKGDGQKATPSTKKDKPAPTGKAPAKDPEAVVHDPEHPWNKFADSIGLGPAGPGSEEEEGDDTDENDD